MSANCFLRLHVWGGLRLVFGRNAGGRSVDGTKSWGPRSAVTVQGIRAAGQARLHQQCRWPVVAWEGLLYGVPMRCQRDGGGDGGLPAEGSGVASSVRRPRCVSSPLPQVWLFFLFTSSFPACYWYLWHALIVCMLYMPHRGIGI